MTDEPGDFLTLTPSRFACRRSNTRAMVPSCSSPHSMTSVGGVSPGSSPVFSRYTSSGVLHAESPRMTPTSVAPSPECLASSHRFRATRDVGGGATFTPRSP